MQATKQIGNHDIPQDIWQLVKKRRKKSYIAVFTLIDDHSLHYNLAQVTTYYSVQNQFQQGVDYYSFCAIQTAHCTSDKSV